MKKSFLLVIVLFLSCQNVNRDSVKEKEFLVNDCRLVTEELLIAIKSKDYNKIKLFYSEDFFSSVTEDAWISTLLKMDEKFGDIKSYELIEAFVNTENGIRSVMLTYSVKREKYRSTEKFLLFPMKGKLRINAHNIKV